MNRNYPIFFLNVFYLLFTFIYLFEADIVHAVLPSSSGCPPPLPQSRLPNIIYKVNPMRLEAVFVVEWLGVDKTMDVGIAQQSRVMTQYSACDETTLVRPPVFVELDTSTIRVSRGHPANTIHAPNVGTMSTHRLHCTNIG